MRLALAIVVVTRCWHDDERAQTKAERSPRPDEHVTFGEPASGEASWRRDAAVTAPVRTPVASLVLHVAIDDTVDIRGTRYRDIDIDMVFRAAFAHDSKTQVVFEVDKGVKHGRVVHLMERAKAAGLTRLAIGTNP